MKEVRRLKHNKLSKQRRAGNSRHLGARIYSRHSSQPAEDVRHGCVLAWQPC